MVMMKVRVSKDGPWLQQHHGICHEQHVPRQSSLDVGVGVLRNLSPGRCVSALLCILVDSRQDGVLKGLAMVQALD